MIEFKSDCRYFKGDLPCVFHKKEGVHCKGCGYYIPIAGKILVIKLASIGDVLRTTALLPALRKKYPASRIGWVTKKNAIDLFKNNPHIDSVLEYPQPATNRIQLERYDLVINLDCNFEGACLASLANAAEKIGFGCDENGRVFPFNRAAGYWLEMSLSDDLKKANRRTYTDIMLEICGLDPEYNHEPVFILTQNEIGFGKKFARDNKITKEDLVIGLNTGGGSRWKQKRWTDEGFLRLIKLLDRKYRPKVLLFGGPDETGRNKYLAEHSPVHIIDTGCGNTLREFASLLNLCTVVVTADTLALHLALALKKKVVAIFGPTSQAEIDLCGRGLKVSADPDCAGCYQRDCGRKITCMDSLRAEKVFFAVKKLVGNK